MHLYLVATLDELRCDEQHLFRMAHVWAFQKDVSVANEVAQYRLHGLIPQYVCRFLKHRQNVTQMAAQCSSSYQQV
jgi:hypothetical protein